MLNYDIHTTEKDIELLESEVQGIGIEGNPFPGLRPFGIDECHLFFGRDGQVDDVLMKLSQNRFVAVMGFSGSGKSSLMYCGLIPVLYGGFMTHAGPNWNVVVTRPGIAPLDNLAESILQADADYLELPEEDRIIQHTVTSSILRSGVKGLVDLAKNIKEERGENLLILVDQFEELFRYKREEEDAVGSNESSSFINMLLEAIKQEETPIYLALTMRSEFIGECAQYPGLTEMINLSNYLVPQMTRDQKRMAIEGPVAVGGGKISARLVKRLLNDVGEQQDQLPVLQHSLMRTWNYWLENREGNEPLDIRHYNAIGKISEALSQHANEAFDELTDKQKQVCEVIFKTITERSSGKVGIRRPTRLIEISQIAGVDDDEVVEIIDHFRTPERSLLMPTLSVELDQDSIIEISHESLIRIWIRLKSWVDEEHESAQMYRRLSDAAEMYQIGRTGLWRPPDLQLALNWQKKQNPTRIWAQRYNEAFERAIVFLDTSRVTYEAEQKNQEMLQYRTLKRAKVVALSLGIAAVILIIFFIFAVIQRMEAINEREEARLSESRALVAQAQAEENFKLAVDQTQLANRSVIRSRVAAQKALASQFYARYQQIQAEQQRNIAIQKERETQLALQRESVALDQARENYNLAEARRADIERLLHLSAAQSMSVKSTNVVDENLQGLLAHQAFLFNEQFSGNPYDPYIYDGLYESMTTFKGSDYNKFLGHKDAVRSVAFNAAGMQFFSAGSDGTIRRWDQQDPTNNQVIVNNGTHPNRVVEISPNGKWMAAGSDSTVVQLINLASGDVQSIEGHKAFVYDIHFLEDNSGFYSLSHDRSIRFYDFNESRVIKHLDTPLKTFDVSPDNSFIIGGSKTGKLIKINLNDLKEETIYEKEGNPIHSVDISPDGRTVAFGDEVGEAHVWDFRGNSMTNNLRGHTARINVVKYSPDGKMLGTGSYDGSVQLYTVGELNELPIVMKDHDSFIWDISFSADSKFLIAGTNSDVLKIWPTRAEFFAEDMCNRLSRNMNSTEWELYVPAGINYRITCSSFNTEQGDD
jgi:ABC-type oligopeptide transport system ATPase subunit